MNSRPTPCLLAAGTALALLFGAGCAATSETSRDQADDEAGASEKVNIGYGSQKPEDVTGSVERATTKDFGNRDVGTVEELIEGQFPGVTLQRNPGGGVRINIQGATSFHGSTEPLYVVDGMSIMPGPNGTLSFLNTKDIQSIEVLKGASASVYGSRGANGVILITTKRP